MKRVIIESPYAGDIDRNMAYLRRCMHDAIVSHGEAPFAGHGIYTQPGVLRDGVPEERRLGIQAGFEWWLVADKIIVYEDYGRSPGMLAAISRAQDLGRPLVFRKIGENKKEQV